MKNPSTWWKTSNYSIKDRERDKKRKEKERRGRKRFHMKDENKNLPWVGGNTIRFGSFSYPEAPDYLGTVIKGVCGYQNSQCLTGIMFQSDQFKTLEGHTKEVLTSALGLHTYSNTNEFSRQAIILHRTFILPKIFAMLFCFKYHPILQKLGDEKRIIASYLAQHTPKLSDCQWLNKLVSVSKSHNNKPSKDHFPIVLWGGKSMGCWDCNASRYRSFNPQTPIPTEAWWTDRWPSHKEAILMKKYFKSFSMGKPPKTHLHGN